MKKKPIMTDLDILYQSDYLEYQEFFMKDLGFDTDKGTILFISAIKHSPFREIQGGFFLEEFIQNGTDRLLREEIYVSKNDKCYRIIISFNKHGIKKYKDTYESSIDEVLEECDSLLGNAPEIIRLLRLEGKDEKADYLETQYKQFLENKNRIPEIKEKVMKEALKEIEWLKKLSDQY